MGKGIRAWDCDHGWDLEGWYLEHMHGWMVSI